jgi:hypothetical protein
MVDWIGRCAVQLLREYGPDERPRHWETFEAVEKFWAGTIVPRFGEFQTMR